MDRNRRQLLKLAGAAGALSLAGCAGMGGGASKARVVVIGGGYGGATAARYLRMWDPAIEVVMVERESMFTSCPMSNLVIGGNRSIDEIRRGYDGLRRHGVQVVNDEVTAVDNAKKTVSLARGGTLTYDRLIVSPGIDPDACRGWVERHFSSVRMVDRYLEVYDRAQSDALNSVGTEREVAWKT